VTVPAARPGLMTSAGPNERPLNTILRWLFLLLVASIPFEFPDRSFPIEIPTLTASLFLAATLLEPRRCYGRRPLALFCFAAYLYAYWLSAALNGREHIATDLITPDYWAQVVKQFLQILQCVLVFWAASNLLRSPGMGRAMLTTLAVASSTFALLPVLGIARTARTVWGGGERITALGQNANNSAMILSAGLLALVGVQYGLNRTPWLRRALAGPVVALLVLAIVDSGSRSALLALAFGLTVFALSGPHTTWTRVRNFVLIAFLLVLIGSVAYNSPVLRRRFEEAMEQGALAGRERIYPALVQMFEERPIFGWGPVNNKYELGIRLDERLRRRRDAHNLILEVLTTSGVLGAVPFLLGIGFCAAAAWEARHRAHGTIPLALVALTLVSNMSGNHIVSKLLWLTWAYAVASFTYGSLRSPPAPAPRPLGVPRHRGAALGPARELLPEPVTHRIERR
jgi:O-antigen ligase